MRRNSIGRQAAVRLAISLGLLVALIAASSVGIYQAALQKAAHKRAGELVSFYTARLDQIEREWELRSRDFKVRIETTRALEDPATAAVNLQAFMTVQGADRTFQYLLIQTADGRKLFDFGKDISLPSIPPDAGVASGHYQDPLGGQIYRVFEHAIWLGENRGMGRFAAFFHIDNALLRQMSTPDLTLTLLHDGVPLASSGGQAAIDHLRRSGGQAEAGKEIRDLPWTGKAADAVRLQIEAPVTTLFSTAELAMSVSLIPLVDGLALWLALGLWLMRQTQRITSLGRAVGEYASNHRVTPAIAATLADAKRGPDDEITSVTAAIEAMTVAIAQRETERRQAEVEYHAIMTTAHDGFWIVAVADGRFLDVNPAACAMLGYSREEMLALSVSDVDAIEGPEETQQHIAAVIARHEERFESRHRRKNGELIDVEISVKFIDLRGGAIVVFIRDVTARKAAAEQLRHSHHLLRTIIDTTPVRIFWKDRAARYLGCNTAFAEDAGEAHPDDLIGKDDYQLGWKARADLYRADDLLVMESGVPKLSFDEPQSTTDGRQSWLRTSKVPLRNDKDGEIIGVLGIYEDVTAYKQSELALIEAKQMAEQANSAKSAFIANMSHEIRTPLHVITGLGDLLRRDIGDPALVQRLDQLCATSDHLLAIVNDILDLSKIDAQQFVLDRSDFRLGTVVDKVVSMVEEQARNKGLMLATHFAPPLRDMALYGDAVRLAQVLINLCSNAIKFTDQGAVSLGVAVVAKDAASVTMRFAVEDTGIGVAPAELARIFRPFTQVDSSTTRERSGTGLGLAISQRLVALMGGTILADSHPGRGSIFSFELILPCATKGVPKTAVTAVAPTAGDFYGRHVLFAEDHPLSQEILLEMLEDLGCEVEVASDGIEAVLCAKSGSYDLILMDMQMPKMDGLAATRAIRALPEHRKTPIIALTANAFADDRQRCLDAGMNGHIGKPVRPATLAAILGQWLPGLSVSAGETPVCENELSLALQKIPGLEVGQAFRCSPAGLVDYVALLNRFLKLHSQDMARLREHLLGGEHDAAHVIAHDLKGVAGLLGVQRVASLATDLVRGLRSGADEAGIALVASACEAELASLLEAVRALPTLQEEVNHNLVESCSF